MWFLRVKGKWKDEDKAMHWQSSCWTWTNHPDRAVGSSHRSAFGAFAIAGIAKA